MKKINLFLLTLLLAQSIPFVQHNVLSTYSYNQADIQDNGVYFIKNVATGKYFDIPYADYNTDRDLITYSFTGFGNQRYILKKEYFNSNEEVTYRIVPLYAQEKTLSIKNENNNDGNSLYFSNIKYTDSSMYSNKFVFERINNNYYYIKTGGGIYSKYLKSENDNIKQYSLTTLESEKSLFQWELIKTDSLNLFSEELRHFASKQDYWYNVKVPYSTEYKFKTGSAYMNFQVYKETDDGLVSLASEIDGVKINLDKDINYKLKVTNTSPNSYNSSVFLEPCNTLFFYGNIDSKGVNWISSPNSNCHYLTDDSTNTRIYPLMYTNVNTERIKEQIGYKFVPLQSKYSIFATNSIQENNAINLHTPNGNASSSITSISNSRFSLRDLPSDLSNAEIMAFLSADSATSINRLNYPREAVKRGAKLAFGFKDGVLTQVLRQYACNLIESIGKGYTGFEAIYKAYKWTYQNQFINWIVTINHNPIVYKIDEEQYIRYCMLTIDDSDPDFSYDGYLGPSNDEDEIIDDYVDESTTGPLSITNNETSNIDYRYVSIEDKTYKLFNYNNILTNIPYDEVSDNDILTLSNYYKHEEDKNSIIAYLKNTNSFYKINTDINKDEVSIIDENNNIMSFVNFVNLANSYLK